MVLDGSGGFSSLLFRCFVAWIFFSLNQGIRKFFQVRCLLLVAGFSHRVYRARRGIPMYIRFALLVCYGGYGSFGYLADEISRRGVMSRV
jgi:uncharacterized membrane protein (UPF0136 family)